MEKAHGVGYSYHSRRGYARHLEAITEGDVRARLTVSELARKLPHRRFAQRRSEKESRCPSQRIARRRSAERVGRLARLAPSVRQAAPERLGRPGDRSRTGRHPGNRRI